MTKQHNRTRAAAGALAGAAVLTLGALGAPGTSADTVDPTGGVGTQLFDWPPNWPDDVEYEDMVHDSPVMTTQNAPDGVVATITPPAGQECRNWTIVNQYIEHEWDYVQGDYVLAYYWHGVADAAYPNPAADSLPSGARAWLPLDPGKYGALYECNAADGTQTFHITNFTVSEYTGPETPGGGEGGASGSLDLRNLFSFGS